MGIDAATKIEGTKVGEFTINSMVYDVILADNLLSKELGDLIGWYRYTNQQIVIQSGLPAVVSEVTLLHEIVHGWLTATGWQEEGTKMSCEQVCEVISLQLYASIFDNPDYYIKLASTLKEGRL